MTDTSILIVSCDKYSDLWKPFFSLYWSFWKDNIFETYLGSNYLRFDDSRIKMLTIGQDKSWSHGLLRMLESIDTKYVIVLLEDFFLRSPMNTSDILKCIDILKELNGQMLRLIPRTGPDKAVTGYPLIGYIKPSSAFRVSTQGTLWRKTALQHLLRDNESIWEFEINGTERSRKYNHGYYCVWKPVLTYEHHVIERGKWFRKEAKRFGAMDIGCDFNARTVMSEKESYLWHVSKLVSYLQNRIPWLVRQRIKKGIKYLIKS